MYATRLVTTAVVTAALAGVAAPAATAVPADGMRATAVTRPIPVPPTWPLHPQPITNAVDARPIPVPPTWPLHPRVIPPPSIAAPLPSVATVPSAGFDWGSAGIGAGTMLATLTLAFVAATWRRRRRGALPRTAATE